MRRRLLLSGSGMFLILAFGLLFLVHGSHVNALIAAPTVIPTATPDVNQILNQVNDAKNQAINAQNAAQDTAKTLFDFVNVILPIVSIVILLVAGALSFYGLNTLRGLKKTQQDSQRALETAKEDYKKEHEDVEKLQTKIKQLQGNFKVINLAYASLRLGDVLFRDDKREMAIEAYSDAKRMLPTNALVNYSLGRAYARTKQYNKAIELLKESFNSNPNSPETSKELGLTYRRIGEEKRKANPLNKDEYMLDYRLAINYLERATQLDPREYDALSILGGLHKRLGDYKTSLDYYLRASNLNREVSYPLGNIGCIQWYKGNLEEARETFKRTEEVATLRIQKQGEEPWWDYYDRALARLMLKRKEEAIADYRIAIDRTHGVVDLESVLDNLLFLKSMPNPKETIIGLDEVIEDIKTRVEKKNAGII